MLTIVSNQKIFTTKDLGPIVKRGRARYHLTQTALAEHANVSRGVVQKLEQGRGTVALDNALRILHILSLDLLIESRSEAETDLSPRD